MYCIGCGTELPENGSFCVNCGIAVPNGQSVSLHVDYEDVLLSNVSKCEKCGSDIAQGLLFCGTCGAKQTQQRVVRMPKCVSCGTLLTFSARYCSHCRTEYKTVEDGLIELPQEPTCPSCGTVIEQDTSFCVICGEALNEKRTEIKKVSPCCSECNANIDPSFPFCNNCGKLWNKGNPKKRMPIRPISAENMIICPICHERQIPNRNVCFSCGIPFKK